MQFLPLDARGRPVVCRCYTLQVGRSRVTSLPSVDAQSPPLPVWCTRTTVDPIPPLVMPNKVVALAAAVRWPGALIGADGRSLG